MLVEWLIQWSEDFWTCYVPHWGSFSELNTTVQEKCMSAIQSISQICRSKSHADSSAGIKRVLSFRRNKIELCPEKRMV